MRPRRNFIKEAAAEAASLITEGYIVRVHHYDEKHAQAYMTLVHSRNGNIIHVNATKSGYVVSKNGTIIKRVI